MDTFLVLPQCRKNAGCFPWGKRAAIVRRYPDFVSMCAVVSRFHTAGFEAYSFTTDGYGICNVRTNVGAGRTREGGCHAGRNKSAQELTRIDRKTVAHHAPARGSNPGSSD